MTDTPANPLLVGMDEENQYKGTLFIEAYDSLIDSIKSGSQDIADLTFNAIGAVASTVSLVLDPFGSLLGAGLGWLMEHIGFLREALDQLLGDPDEIQRNVDDTTAKAVDLRVLAEDHRKSLVPAEGWSGAASEKFQGSMDTLGKELDCLANAVEAKAKVVAIMGTLVTVVRDVVRDMIAQFVGSVVANGLIGLAGAIFTFGASLGYAVGQIVREAVEVGSMIASKIKYVIKALGDLLRKIGDLDDVMAKVGKGWDRFDNAADAAEISYEGYKAADRVDDAIDKGLRVDAAADKYDDASAKVKEAAANYQAAKEAESKEADDVAKANADLSAATNGIRSAATDVTRAAGELDRLGGELNRSVDETNRAAAAVDQAAKSGDRAAYDAAVRNYDAARTSSLAAKAEYDAAKKAYDTADTKYDAARAKAAESAAAVARESRELSDRAKASYAALQAGKPADEAAKVAYDEYLKETGGKPNPELNAKNDAAKAANETYEKANVDFMDKNAAAAEANAKAFASGKDADIKAAEQAALEAQAAAEKLDSAAADARSAADAAQKAYQAATGGKGGGEATGPGNTDPLEYARQVNASTNFTDTFKGDAFLGDAGRRSDGSPSPSVPPVKH
jgi:hypothetical protein